MHGFSDLPPKPFRVKRTTLGKLMWRAANRPINQFTSLLVPRHAMMWNKETGETFPVWQKCTLLPPGAPLYVGVVYDDGGMDPRVEVLLADTCMDPFHTPDRKLTLATRDKTPSKKSLVWLAARTIALNWDSYDEDSRELIWTTTLMTVDWEAQRREALREMLID